MIQRDEALFQKIIAGSLSTQPSNTHDLAVFASLRFSEHWKRVAMRTVYVSTNSAFVTLSGDRATFPLDSVAFQTLVDATIQTRTTVEDTTGSTVRHGASVAAEAIPTSRLDAASEHSEPHTLSTEVSTTHYTIVAGGDEASPTWRIKAPPGSSELIGTLVQDHLMASAVFGDGSTRNLLLSARSPSFALMLRVDGPTRNPQRNRLGLTRLILKRAICDHDFNIGSAP